MIAPMRFIQVLPMRISTASVAGAAYCAGVSLPGVGLPAMGLSDGEGGVWATCG